MLGNRAPSLVVDAPVGEHLEVLQVVALRHARPVERVEHGRALHGRLLDAVHHGRLGQPGRFEDRGRHVDHMRELGAQAAALLDPVGPVHDGAVAGAAPVRGHLLGPLERGVHRPRPPDCIVVVGAGRAELVHLGHHEPGGLQRGHPVEVRHLVEGAVNGAFGGRAVIANDVVDDRVVEGADLLDGIDDPADVMVGVLQEPGVYLHFPLEHRLELFGHVLPRRDLGMSNGELGIGGDDPHLLLAGKRALPQSVPAVREPAGVPVGPLLGDMVRRVGRTRHEVHEKWPVGH